jgi:hypothetical protein
MRLSFGVVIVCAAAVGLALPVAGQAPRSRMTTVTMGNPAPVARLPYTAEYKITRVQTLVNGSTITHESTETVTLDSQGRRMTSSTTIPLLENQTPITRVSVMDPVARTNSSWTVPGQKATVVAMPTPGAPRNCATNVVLPPIPHNTGVSGVKPTVEDLGTETIQGVEARGHRITTTIPAGAIGNDAPLTSITESWTATAPGLRGLVARNVFDNPQSGKTARELTNFTQAEPDASVFQPPEGYEIVNKPAPGAVCPGDEGTETPMAPIPPPPPPPQ